MNERDKLIEKLIAEKGGSREDYLTLLNSIAYHESAHTLDPTIKQIGGGPGRGKYQFEVGKHRGGITAAKRTKKYYEDNKIPVPKWLDKAASGNDLDATSLTSQQQDILFLGNMRQHPKADLGKVISGKESITDFWANYHWAGNIKERKERVNSFNDSLNKLKNEKKNFPIAKSNKNSNNPMDYILSSTIKKPIEPSNDTKQQINNYIKKLDNKVTPINWRNDFSTIDKLAAKLTIGSDNLDEMQDLYNKLVKYKNERGDNKEMSKEEIELREKIANAKVFGYVTNSPSQLIALKNRIKEGKNESDGMLNYENNVNKQINIRKALNNKYYGLPYDDKLIVPSEYKPKLSKDKDAKYFQFTNEDIKKNISSFGENFDDLYNAFSQKPTVKRMAALRDKKKPRKFNVLDQLQDYTMSAGKDEKGRYLSYYDKWDLDPEVFKERNIDIDKLNYPFEIYGRIYEDNFNNKSKGGLMPSNTNNNVFNAFNEGGLHEQNPHGGVPQGMGANGKMNTVEEGEASYNFDDGKYIFSNRLS